MTDPRLAELARLLPELKLSVEPGDLEHHGRDWTRRWTPAPLAVVWPSSIEEVQDIVRWANGEGLAIVPSGGRTGLSGGAVAAHGEVVVSLDRMNRVLDFDPIDRTLTVQPGIALEAVQNAARERGLLYPVNFAARGSCQIGGTIATNAGGIRVIRYGNTRQWIAGLKVVTGTGELLDLNRGLVKNASGYDLRHLVIGSEGTLGIVVEATLSLASPPPPSQVMLLAIPAMDALMKVFAEARHRLRLEAFEFFTDKALRHVLAHGAQKPFEEEHPFYVVTEFDDVDGPAEGDAMAFFEFCLGEGWVVDGAIASSEAQASSLWRLREGITESLASHKPYKNDVSVRISAVPAFMDEMQTLLAAEYPHFDVVWFGHIGDGNLHINVLKPAGLDSAMFVEQCEHVTTLLVETLARHGGSISAEHGIGLVKKPWLGSVRSEAEIALMRGIKAVWDPNNIMNPGKLL
jgi:FAD/FMN-containing dehydrogenase